MVALPPFSSTWPIRVYIRDDITSENEAWAWLQSKASELGLTPSDLFTAYTNRIFGFKDKKLAMEFKLIFG